MKSSKNLAIVASESLVKKKQIFVKVLLQIKVIK